MSRGGKKQLRRSISLAPTTYERLRALAELNDTPMAQVIERLLECEARACGIQVERAAAVARANERHLRVLDRRDELAEKQREEADSAMRGAFGC